MNQSANRSGATGSQADRPQVVTPQILRRLEAALGSVGAFGEVRLVVLKGRVRFIEVLRSESLAGRADEWPVIENSDVP
jgi:hypothetical protein